MCDGGETTSGPGSLLMVGLELRLFAGDETGTVGLLGLAQCLPAVGLGHLTDWSLRFPLLVRPLSYCDNFVLSASTQQASTQQASALPVTQVPLQGFIERLIQASTKECVHCTGIFPMTKTIFKAIQ